VLTSCQASLASRKGGIIVSEKYWPTGNEWVAIPTLRESDAAIESLNFLHMGLKGLVEVCGETGQAPLLRPIIRSQGCDLDLGPLTWRRTSYWIPAWSCQTNDIFCEGMLLAPIGERGFAVRLQIENLSATDLELQVGTQGVWHQTLQTINESKPLRGQAIVTESTWNQGFAFEYAGTQALFAFAPMFDQQPDILEVSQIGQHIHYTFMKNLTIKPGMKQTVIQYWGLGYEEVSAVTAAKEMLRHGFEILYQRSIDWLNQRVLNSRYAPVNSLMNTNLFFNLFYASGLTLDTEERVLVTSRSPRYYVSAAYWDRDSLLWSFPSMLLADAEMAREALDYVFTRQIRNVGTHSRFIDGTVLEPGFELDELCAPLLALDRYIRSSKDRKILKDAHYANGIAKISRELTRWRHARLGLYETFLQPTDDEIVHPFLTYNNVLVWKTLQILANFSADLPDFLPQGREHYLSEASQVAAAIRQHCVKSYQGREIFAWSIDATGNWNVYDEPPGSLLLLPYLGFCEPGDPVYLNTVDVIRDPGYAYSFHGCKFAEIGCSHAPHPWVLSMANSLLSGRIVEFINYLPDLKMDNGIACESVDEHTGESTTGDAFATCAGFLVYAMAQAFGLEA